MKTRYPAHAPTSINRDALADMVQVIDSDFARGTQDAETVALEWLGYGFNARRAVEWVVFARCFDPAAAFYLMEAGVTPKQAGRRLGVSGESIGYSLSNGDLSIERAVHLSKEGEES